MNQQNVQFKDLSGTYLQTPKHECKFNINVNYVLYDIIYIIYSHDKHESGFIRDHWPQQLVNKILFYSRISNFLITDFETAFIATNEICFRLRPVSNYFQPSHLRFSLALTVFNLNLI